MLKLAHKRSSTLPPPPELLQAWLGQTTATASAKPRGRNGPHADGSAAGGSDDLKAVAAALLAVAAQQAAATAAATAAAAPPPRVFAAAALPAGRDDPRSSPPPALDEELASCLHRFGVLYKLSADAVDRAVRGLDEASYSATSIEEAEVTRLKELTGLPEGQVLNLKRYARKWCGKVEDKRARHGT